MPTVVPPSDPEICWPDGGTLAAAAPVDDYAARRDAGLAEQRALLASQGYTQAWNTDEASQMFRFESFIAGFAIVRRIEDDVKGSLDFTPSPRLYYDFKPDTSGHFRS